MSEVIEAALRFYRRWVSPAIHSLSGASGACRFQPTCSEYAATAIARFGALRGSFLALWRLLRCQPFAHGGVDPVPQRFPLRFRHRFAAPLSGEERGHLP